MIDDTKNIGRAVRPPSDDVNHPRRYTKGKVECIDAIESAVVGKPPDEAVCVANIVKYLWRYEEKEPVRSLESARWYLDRLIGKVRKRLLPEAVSYSCEEKAIARGAAISGAVDREPESILTVVNRGGGL